MAISEVDLDSPAIQALGSRFKLTEVFLWDDGYSTEVAQDSLFPKHIRFKYDSDDNDDNDPTRKSSNSTLETAEVNSAVTEDVELTQQMSALGLPLSFQTNKQVQTKVKNKASKSRNKLNQKVFEPQVNGSSTLDKESSPSADAREKSGNSSSSLLHQTDIPCFGGDLCVEFGVELVCHALEEQIHDRKKICDDSVEQNETSVDKSLTEQVDTGRNEFDEKEIPIEDLGSCNTIEQTQVADLPRGSQNIDNGSSSESTGDWSACWDTFYMRYYFYNAKTLESTWHPPPGMEGFALADYSCEVGELKEELNGGNEEEVPNFENERVDRCELISETCSDEQPGGKPGSDRCPSLKQEIEEVNHDECHDVFESKDLELPGPPDSFNHGCFDGSVVVELGSASSSTSAAKEECGNDDISQMRWEEVETMVNEIDMQNTAVSTKRKKKRKNRRRKKLSNDNEVQLVQEFHIDITKYWYQRYLLFSKFDHGIKMDEEGWFSVTPEAIAKHHASRSGGGIVIDCFVGVGGNAIQFAKASEQVIGIDIDSSRIDYAHHNAIIYGVEEKIDFVMGDSFALATKLTADTVFLSPPWGGPDYAKLDSYDIDMLLPYDGHCLFNTFKAVASTIVMFLPRNVNIEQLAELSLNADTPWSLEVEKNYLNGKLKAVTAYFSKISESNG